MYESIDYTFFPRKRSNRFISTCGRGANAIANWRSFHSLIVRLNGREAQQKQNTASYIVGLGNLKFACLALTFHSCRFGIFFEIPIISNSSPHCHRPGPRCSYLKQLISSLADRLKVFERSTQHPRMTILFFSHPFRRIPFLVSPSFLLWLIAIATHPHITSQWHPGHHPLTLIWLNLSIITVTRMTNSFISCLDSCLSLSYYWRWLLDKLPYQYYRSPPPHHLLVVLMKASEKEQLLCVDFLSFPPAARPRL